MAGNRKRARRRIPRLKMKKRTIIKPDGRYLIFYEFEGEKHTRKSRGEQKRKTP